MAPTKKKKKKKKKKTKLSTETMERIIKFIHKGNIQEDAVKDISCSQSVGSKILVWMVGYLVRFYRILTLASYLMANPVYIYIYMCV